MVSAMSETKVKVWCSPVTGRIYTGYVQGNQAHTKTEVTKEVIDAVMQHMDMMKIDYYCAAGDLVFKHKDIVPTESSSDSGSRIGGSHE